MFNTGLHIFLKLILLNFDQELYLLLVYISLVIKVKNIYV